MAAPNPEDLLPGGVVPSGPGPRFDPTAMPQTLAYSGSQPGEADEALLPPDEPSSYDDHDPDDAVPKLTTDQKDAAVRCLQAFIHESYEARRGGLNPRDQQWEENLHVYWNRFDFTGKMAWQSKQRIPKLGSLVDRFAAAMQLGLTQAGRWFDVVDEDQPGSDLEPIVWDFMRKLLDRCGRNQTGQAISFEGGFGDTAKQGTVAIMSSAVTWDDDCCGVRVENVLHHELFLDPSGRGGYRRRRYEVDLWQVKAMADEKDEDGRPIYDAEAIAEVRPWVDHEARRAKEVESGIGEQTQSHRQTVYIDEFLATITDESGELICKNALVVMANESIIIRGPEENPFAHGEDWIVATPLINVPGAPYGKTYAENVVGLIQAYVELTNLILDAAFRQAMNPVVVNEHLLEDPTVLDDGLCPGLTLHVREDADARAVASTLELGVTEPEVIQVWTGLGSEIREAGLQSEISLGQVAPKGDVTATAINASSSAQGSLQSAIVNSTEERYLDPVLRLVWMTAVQHLNPADDPRVALLYGEKIALMLATRRDEFLKRRFRFKARGLSGLIERQQKARGMLNALQVVGQSDILLQAAMQALDPVKILAQIFLAQGVDISQIKRDQPLPPAPPQPPPGAVLPPGAAPAQGQRPMTNIPENMGGVPSGQLPQG